MKVSLVSFHSVVISLRIPVRSSILVHVHAEISPNDCIVGIISSALVHNSNNELAVSLTFCRSNQFFAEKLDNSERSSLVFSELPINLSKSSETFW